MSLRPLSSEWMSDMQEERISALEQELEQLRDTLEGLRDTFSCTEDGELTIEATTIRLRADENIEVRAGNTCEVTSMNSMRIDSSGRLELHAGTMDVSSGTQTINAPMTSFSGMIRCSTIQADSVIGASYTPGAGNLQ